ncbi:hypothetical protein D3C87_1058190 [compost metagenome]
MIEGPLELLPQQMGRNVDVRGEQHRKIRARDAIDLMPGKAVDHQIDEVGNIPDVGIPGLEAALGIEAGKLGGADQHQDGGLGRLLQQQLGEIAPERMAVAQARHLVLGCLLLQFAYLAMCIEFGFTEGGKQLA